MDINSNQDPKLLGIVTLHGYHNYGNKLQNYALREAVKSLGFEVTTIVIERNKRLLSRIKNIILFRTPIPRRKIRRYFKVQKESESSSETHQKLIDNRTMIFKSFSETDLCENFINLDNKNSKKSIDKYDYFITGSDQVWNPIYIYKMNDYFLKFADEKKRIAYAPSFSCPKLPEEHKKKYHRWLKGMSNISVREKEGAEIIRELTGIDVPVLVDPTLLLNKEKWLTIGNKASNRSENAYILTYFLGEVDEEIELYIQNLASERNMEIIRLGDIHDKETFLTGPKEFIDYVHSSSIFFTDSFHGVVFSILLETPFVVYERKTKGATMYSRIETLLDKFNLRDREAKNIYGLDDIFSIDYSHVPSILEAERKKSFDYLKDALNIKDA